MYDDQRKIMTDWLDKTVIHNREKIRDKYRQDIQTMGQKQYISAVEDMKLRELLLSPQNEVEDTKNEKFGCMVLLSLEILFTIAVLIASLAVTVMPQAPAGRTMADAISAFFFIEIPLWLPFLIIMNNRSKLKKAVQKGNFEKYNFQIREKVYQEFWNEDYMITKHYIEIAGMYVPIRENLITGLECWQTISVVLVEYKGIYYFSYLNQNVFYNDNEDDRWWNALSRKKTY